MGNLKSKSDLGNNTTDKKTSKRAVLCLSSSQTYLTVGRTFKEDLGVRKVIHVKTVKEATAHLSDGNNMDKMVAFVCALGTRPGIDTIFSKDSGDRSDIIDLAKKKGLPVFVFSHTAREPENAYMIHACEDAGADAVVCTRRGLREEYVNVLLSRRNVPNKAKDETAKKWMISSSSSLPGPATSTNKTNADSDGDDDDDDSSPSKMQTSVVVRLHHWGETWSKSWLKHYEPLLRRQKRDRYLKEKIGASHRFTDHALRTTMILQGALQKLTRPLIAPSEKRAHVVRFVHVSDTHGMEDHLILPEGDVLLHSGDCVGNYRKADIHADFEKFVRWLAEMSKRYKHVVFIAGNHDTQLDNEFYDATRAEALLKLLPPNVHYLKNSGVVVESLRIFGSPMCVSRKEVLQKRYLSDAFERPIKTRESTYENDCKDGEIDVLMTHPPPAGILCANSKRSKRGPGDHVLRAHLDKLKAPPAVCCFGHDHDFIGVERRGATLYVNGAQQQLLQSQRRFASEWRSGGCALVFDVPRRASTPEKPVLREMRSAE